jgi:hypothetical protein
MSHLSAGRIIDEVCISEEITCQINSESSLMSLI